MISLRACISFQSSWQESAYTCWWKCRKLALYQFLKVAPPGALTDLQPQGSQLALSSARLPFPVRAAAVAVQGDTLREI